MKIPLQILNLLIAAALFAILVNRNYRSLPKQSVYILFVLWIAFWTVEYWILGPASNIHYQDEADFTVSRYLHDVNYYIGGSFLHGLQGGADYYASQHGGQYISLERFLFRVFPLWVAVLLHKLMVVCISALGCYALVRKVTKATRFYAFCFSSLFSVFNPYALYTTTLHGIGYAALPLTVYVYVFRAGKSHYFTYCLLLSLLIGISVSPIHAFLPVLASIVLGLLFISDLRNSPRILASTLMLLIVILLNWSEALFGFATYGAGSARAIIDSAEKDMGELFWGSLIYFFGKTDFELFNIVKFSPTLTLLVITLVWAFISRATMRYKFALNIFLAMYLSSVVYLVPWADLGLSFINAVSFVRISWYAVIPLIIMAGLLTARSQSKSVKLLPILFLTFAVLVLGDRKVMAFFETLAGNQLRLTSIRNLVERKWEPNELYRAVATGPFYAGVHPNFLWAYGIETLDGFLVLVPSGYVDFWHYGIHRDDHDDAKRDFFPSDNMYVIFTEESGYAKGIDLSRVTYLNIDEFVDANLLRLANVSHLVSYLPVRGKGIRKVSGPDDSLEKAVEKARKKERSYFERLTARWKFLFRPEDVFVYAIDDYSQRAFFPEKMQKYDKSWSLSETYGFMSTNYHRNPGFTSDLRLVPASGEVLSVREVPNGYQIDVNVFRPGVFVVNTFPLTYWKAYVDGMRIDTFPINVIHLGLNVPAGKHRLTIMYERQLFRHKVISLIRGLF